MPGKRALAERRGLREGFTTGACSAAAARAAARTLISGARVLEIGTDLPNGRNVVFPVDRCTLSTGSATCVVVKDAGDDPDVTHGAMLTARVSLRSDGELVVQGGVGVATVTKPGLGLVVGQPAINPVPLRNIADNVRQELPPLNPGASVTISVPGGEEMAKGTLNGRLGLVGGISILGTTGIVKPYSTSAYKASVVQAIEVARTRQRDNLVMTTGGKSERYAMALFERLPEDAFVQVGDFIGVGLKHAKRRGCPQVHIVGMIGKLSKMAAGVMQTHQAGSQVNLQLLAELCRAGGGAQSLCDAVARANTARHALELCTGDGFSGLPSQVCAQVCEHAVRYVNGGLSVRAVLIDFDGEVLGDSSLEFRETT